MPAPTATGVLGIIRMIGYSPPAICRSRCIESPAAIETSTKGSVRAASRGASSASTPAIIWGLTPRKTKSQSAAASLPAAVQPSSLASASALAAVRLASTTCPAPAPRQTARATAPPMFPQPINPYRIAWFPPLQSPAAALTAAAGKRLLSILAHAAGNVNKNS